MGMEDGCSLETLSRAFDAVECRDAGFDFNALVRVFDPWNLLLSGFSAFDFIHASSRPDVVQDLFTEDEIRLGIGKEVDDACQRGMISRQFLRATLLRRYTPRKSRSRSSFAGQSVRAEHRGSSHRSGPVSLESLPQGSSGCSRSRSSWVEHSYCDPRLGTSGCGSNSHLSFSSALSSPLPQSEQQVLRLAIVLLHCAHVRAQLRWRARRVHVLQSFLAVRIR